MISRNTFLALVLPSLETGEHYCTLGIKSVNDKDIIKQRFVDSIEQISEHADEFVADGCNAFYAMAKYGAPKDGRTTKNAGFLKSFYIDLDCGPGKPYADLSAGMLALREFCKAASLPRPTIVKSGLGAHVYWVMAQAMPRLEWSGHAERLKELCAQHKFAVDPAVTGEAARVLRIPETLHVKDPTNPIKVEILYVAPELSLEEIQKLLTPSQSTLDALGPAPKYALDATTLALMGNKEAQFKRLLIKSVEGTGCAQIRNIYDNQATLEEPLWRAGLSIAQQCVDRDKAIHAISHKHPTYSVEATEEKANATKGPYTCETFKKLNPSLCEGCPHKIATPLKLGEAVVEATEEYNAVLDVEPITKELKTYVIPKYPFPFLRGRNGGIYQRVEGEDGNDKEELVYPYDFYVVKRMIDPDQGEMLLLRLHLPKDGVREFIIPLGAALAKDKFVSAISAVGVTALGKRQDALMYYVTRSVEELQMQSTAEKSYHQFGWVEDKSAIIVGDKEIRATGSVYSPPSNSTLPNIAYFQTKGDFHVWKNIINYYGTPGMENRAFAFFMGFGALLMKFTALDGFLLNLVFRGSGSGKSTILHAINSIYGRPKELIMAHKDTYNARMQRMGVMQNLAVTMDEITNMDPMEMSNQVYDTTSGRAKNRLERSANKERNNHTKWQTGLITSSNRWVTDALLSVKGFPDGELKRIMEIEILKDINDNPIWAREHFEPLMSNYGHAIEPYCQALVGQTPMVEVKLKEMRDRVDRAADIRNAERYWSLMVSLSLTGGAIAKQLGLHDIPIRPVFDYGIQLIKDTRERTRTYMFDADEFLGLFLQTHFHQILVINGKIDKRTGLEHGAIKEPRGALTVRYEPDTKLLYVLYDAYRKECDKRMLNYDETLKGYRKNKAVIIHADGKETHRKRMLAGTTANGNTAVRCLWFDTTKLDFFKEEVILNDAGIQPADPDPVD